MRADMAKVIVERPRFGSRLPSRKKGYRKFVQRVPLEDQPQREPMLGRWKGCQRNLNEHLGPMRQFLRSNIGRPWNKVHKDLCEHVSFNNPVQAHVLTHVYQYVNQHVEVMDSAHVVLVFPAWAYGHRLGPGEMYICPRTGLLKAVRPDRRRSPRTRIPGEGLVQYLWRDNVWWEVQLRHLPDDPEELWDVWLERDVADLTAEDSRVAYGGKLFAVSKRPLNREETKQLYRKLRQRSR